jgi:hypothetical protein
MPISEAAQRAWYVWILMLGILYAISFSAENIYFVASHHSSFPRVGRQVPLWSHSQHHGTAYFISSTVRKNTALRGYNSGIGTKLMACWV